MYANLCRVVSATAFTLLAGLGCLLLGPSAPQAADEVKPGAFRAEAEGRASAIIGNTLADRMQHDGWLETLLQSRFPKHELVVRNLGFSADELTIRPRSQNFGTPEHWLTFNKADASSPSSAITNRSAAKPGCPSSRPICRPSSRPPCRQVQRNHRRPPGSLLPHRP